MKSVTVLSTIKNIKDTVNLWLDSIISQEYNGEFNIVIIDSFSTDGTAEIIKEYAKRYCKIQVKEVETTQPEALNYAIKNDLLSGELVALIDGDCIAPPEWLHTIVETLEKECVDAVGGPGLTPKTANTMQKIIGFDLDARFLSIPSGLVMRHPNMNLLIKKSLLLELKFNEEFLSGYDADFCYRLNSSGHKMWYSASSFVWHSHRSSLRKYIKQQFFTGRYAFKLYKKNKKGLKGDEINSTTMTLQPIIFGSIFLTLPLVFFSSSLFLIPVALLLFLFILFTMNVTKALIVHKTHKVLLLYFLYMIRLPTWVAGAVFGVFKEI